MTEYIYTAHMADGNEIQVRSKFDYEDFIKRLGALRVRYSENGLVRENPFAINIDMELGAVIDQESDYDRMQIVNIDQICYFTIQRVR